MSCVWLKALLMFVFYSLPSGHNDLIWGKSDPHPWACPLNSGCGVKINSLVSPLALKEVIHVFPLGSWQANAYRWSGSLYTESQMAPGTCVLFAVIQPWMYCGNLLCCATITWIKISASIQIQCDYTASSLTLPSVYAYSSIIRRCVHRRDYSWKQTLNYYIQIKIYINMYDSDKGVQKLVLLPL